jgi:hypothetical protein
MSDAVLIFGITAGLLVAIHLRLLYLEARKRRLIDAFLDDPERRERQGT